MYKRQAPNLYIDNILLSQFPEEADTLSCLQKGDQLIAINHQSPLDYLVSSYIALPQRAQERPKAELERCYKNITLRRGRLYPLPDNGASVLLTFQREGEQFNIQLKFLTEKLQNLFPGGFNPKKKSAPFSIHHFYPVETAKDQFARENHCTNFYWESVSFEELSQLSLEEKQALQLHSLIKVEHFSLPTDAVFKQFLIELEESKKVAKRWSIDLRDNPGGQEQVMLLLLSLFIDHPIQMPYKLCRVNEWIAQQAKLRACTFEKILSHLGDPNLSVQGLPAPGLLSSKAILEKLYSGDCALVQAFEECAQDFQPKHKRNHSFLFSSILLPVGGSKWLTPLSAFSLTRPDFQPASYPPVDIYLNEHSASASEIFAASLQDNGRASILGTRSSGAGGEVRICEFTPHLGVEKLLVTTSLVIRDTHLTNRRIDNSIYIEDFGVTAH